MKKYKILIFGAGAIGSIFATKFSIAGYSVYVYARNQRLKELQEKGLLYEENGKTKQACVHILDSINDKQIFDFIFVTVRHNQVDNALRELRDNMNLNLVMMTNNIREYSVFENIVGPGKIIPAFPGAGGSIHSGILHYKMVPKAIQKTVVGEVNGEKSKRILMLVKIMHNSKIPCNISKNIAAWQKSHVAMITALETGIYFDGGNNYTTAQNKKALNYICNSLKRNFGYLRKLKIEITPYWLKLFTILPNFIIRFFLKNITQY